MENKLNTKKELQIIIPRVVFFMMIENYDEHFEALPRTFFLKVVPVKCLEFVILLIEHYIH